MFVSRNLKTSILIMAVAPISKVLWTLFLTRPSHGPPTFENCDLYGGFCYVTGATDLLGGHQLGTTVLWYELVWAAVIPGWGGIVKSKF